MSKERAHRRAERERELAAAEAARRAEAERLARRRTRTAALTRLLPRSSGQSGTLAARKRQATGLVVAGVIALNVLVWLGTTSWAPRAFFLLLCLLVAPIVASLVSRK